MKPRERTFCPLCGYKLNKRNEGMVCKNWKCQLYFKCGKGWVMLINGSEEQMRVNDLWNSNSRVMFAKRFADLKKIILLRDNYTCQFCGYKLSEDFYRTTGLVVHHIVPSHKESALYFDEDNLIIVCNDCHKILHSTDKHKFGNLNGKN